MTGKVNSTSNVQLKAPLGSLTSQLRASFKTRDNHRGEEWYSDKYDDGTYRLKWKQGPTDMQKQLAQTVFKRYEKHIIEKNMKYPENGQLNIIVRVKGNPDEIK